MFYKVTQNEAVGNEEILTKSATSANLIKHSNKHTSLYNFLLAHLTTIDQFSTYFHGNKYIVIKQYNFIFY